jgi:D-3-phosphoglycerate dehydrogenase
MRHVFVLNQVIIALNNGAQHLRFVDMLNKSRDEVAYTLVDIEGRVSDTVVNNLKQVEGILMVRSL